MSDITIIGHSMGGTLAIDLAASLPDKIDKLILIVALPAMREIVLPGVTADKIQYNSPFNNQMLHIKDDVFKQMTLMIAGNMAGNQAKIDTLASWMVAADRATYGYTDLMKLVLRQDLMRVKAKALILGATFLSKQVANSTLKNNTRMRWPLKVSTLLCLISRNGFIRK